MSPAKKYQPHCPASDCSGGHANRLNKAPHTLIAALPAEILARHRPADDKIYRCNYCGLVWFQSSERLIGFDPLPLGHYDVGHSRFYPITQDFKIRESNKANSQSSTPRHKKKTN
jgi:hypothetical protein